LGSGQQRGSHRLDGGRGQSGRDQTAQSLINDPYAEVLVRAAGVDLFARLASGSLEYEDVGPGWLPEYFAVRTRFFDDFLTRVMRDPPGRS
jgi:O-methyltransferase involved in polyketide biosynthesis